MDYGNHLKGLFDKYPVIESFSQFDGSFFDEILGCEVWCDGGTPLPSFGGTPLPIFFHKKSKNSCTLFFIFEVNFELIFRVINIFIRVKRYFVIFGIFNSFEINSIKSSS